MFNNIGFPTFLFLFIIFCAWLRYEIHKDSKKPNGQQTFLERERLANMTPPKSLNNLDYITIPLDKLPFGALQGHKEIDHMEYTIRSLAQENRKIVNLTGITNTDIKLEYGAANIVKLMEYDASYITLIKTLQEWADVLYEEKLYNEVKSLLEFSVSTKCDIAESYSMLCDIYKNHLGLSDSEAIEKIKALQPYAAELKSMNKATIENSLKKELGQNQALPIDA